MKYKRQGEANSRKGNSEMRGRQTYMKVQLTFVEFIGDDRGGSQGYVGGGNSFPEVA